VLDLGCGYGPLGLSLAALRPGVEAVLSDVNRRALALAEENARALGVAALVLESDGFAQVNGLFDHIVTNPPIRAGKSVYYPWFDQAPGHLREGGSFWCVVQKKQGAPSALSALKASFGECRKAAGAAGYQVLHAVKRAAVR
jgi:16S rRNA (guanine1207-N2)-methyltransferase